MPDEDDLTQEYLVYFKENRQRLAEKDPSVGVLTIFKQVLEFLRNKVFDRLFQKAVGSRGKAPGRFGQSPASCRTLFRKRFSIILTFCGFGGKL